MSTELIEKRNTLASLEACIKTMQQTAEMLKINIKAAEADEMLKMVKINIKAAEAADLQTLPRFVRISTAKGLAFDVTENKDITLVPQKEGQIFRVNQITEGEHKGLVEFEAHGGMGDGLLLNNCGHLNKNIIMWKHLPNGKKSNASLWKIQDGKLLSQTHNKTNPVKRFIKVQEGRFYSTDGIRFSRGDEDGDAFTFTAVYKLS